MPTELNRILRGELPCWEIRHRNQTLVIAEQGAQVLEYQHDGEPPVIWLSEQAAYHSGQAVRGGVPVCWPWFGALERNPEAVRQPYSLRKPPAHGLVRNRPWERVSQQLDPDTATLVFRLAGPHHDDLPAVTPTLTVSLDTALTLSLTNHNHGHEPVTLSQALHSYFAVADSRQVRIQGLDACPYVDALDDWRRHQQHGALSLQAETDRLYLALPNLLHIDDPVWQRRISLAVSGSRSAVIWNPWTTKSDRLSQFAGDAWQHMLCIETARVLDDVLTLAPGQRHEMAVRFMTSAL